MLVLLISSVVPDIWRMILKRLFFFIEIVKYVVGYRNGGFRAELLVLMEEIW